MNNEQNRTERTAVAVALVALGAVAGCAFGALGVLCLPVPVNSEQVYSIGALCGTILAGAVIAELKSNNGRGV